MGGRAPLPPAGRADKRRLLRELALYLYQEHEHSPVIDEDLLLNWVDEFAAGLRLPEESNHDDLLEEVVRTSGLVRERAIRRYGFSHLTLQEYFVAEAVHRKGPDEGAALLSEHLANPRWREVILLYCGLADNADPLLRQVLLRARSGGNKKAGWLQAGSCLAEGARNVDAEVVEDVVSGLVALLRRAEEDDEVDDQPSLTSDESIKVVEQLQTFAVAELPDQVRTLLDFDNDQDALLAARLLPASAGADLRDEVNRRMAALTRAEDSDVRRTATTALGHTGTAGQEIVAALRAALAAEDAKVRAEAVRALGRQGAADEGTLEALLRLHATDPDDAPRHAALNALLTLGQADALEVVEVSAGEFLMGSAADDPDAENNEKPQHSVYLPTYYMDRTPVTNAQYRRFMEAGGYANSNYWAEAIAAGRWRDGKYIDFYDDKPYTEPRYWNDSTWNGNDQPVVGVSWYEGLAYARWAGKRLPSEAEWEKAARWDLEKDHSRRYPWGDEWVEGRANTEEAGHKRTTPVGAYSSDGDSPSGGVDMAGNVWEWCSTRWDHDYPYDPNDGREDLSGGDNVNRVLRGGSWYNDKGWGRCAYRFRTYPWNWRNLWGFRCCFATSSPPGAPES